MPQMLFQNTITRNILLIFALYAAVLIADASILTHDIMYPEQPTLYLVNQSIHSFTDLLNVYLYPKGLDDVVPFFRPSGHFLMYQLLVPLFGWHNTRALVAVNLFFLALSGWLMIRIYQMLFPSAKWGGYLAFGIYLMHPALIMPRFLIMHFEFAHVFFLLLGLYFFILFCEKNNGQSAKKFSLLGYAIVAYVIAVTFKESAIMLAPLLIIYFVLHHRQSVFKKQNLEIIFLLSIVTVVMGLYLTLAWPQLAHPFRHAVSGSDEISVLNQFLRDLTGVSFNFFPQAELPFQNGVAWHEIVFPKFVCVMTILFLLTGIINGGRILLVDHDKQLKKAILFLLAAVIIFLVIPLRWAMALPWHWHLSIVFLSLLMGWGVESLIQKITDARAWQRGVIMSLFASTIIFAMQINEKNITHILQRMPMMQLTRQAISNPPSIRNQLTPESVIVIATRPDQDAYQLGNAGFGYVVLKKFNYDQTRKKYAWLYRQYDTHFNGTLFKWAYLMPTLREELFPFSVDQMQKVPNEEIYSWLQQGDNIFCFTADDQWHDVTKEFRQNLLREKARRHLIVNSYEVQYAQHLVGDQLSRVNLPYPDRKICQYVCDQNILCKGFLFINDESGAHAEAGFELYRTISHRSERDFCPVCEGFVKL